MIRDSIQFRKITKKINGGYNGFADRYAIWLRARKALKIINMNKKLGDYNLTAEDLRQIAYFSIVKTSQKMDRLLKK